MTRRFYRRGKPVELAEVEGIGALRKDDHDAVLKASGRTRPGAGATPIPVAPGAGGLRSGEDDHLDKAGWRSLETAEIAAMDLKRTVPGALHAVMVREDGGHIGVIHSRLCIRFKPDLARADCEAFIKAQGMEICQRLPFAPNLYEVETTDGTHADVKSMLIHEAHGDTIVHAEPVIHSFHGTREISAKPSLAKQWQWHNAGEPAIFEGKVGADMNAVAAWQATKGAGTRVAVVDRGFHHRCRELAGNVDLGLSGRFGPDGTFTPSLEGIAAKRHGTFCAAQAAANSDNGPGTFGAAPEARLMLLAVGSSGEVTQLELARAIAFAASPRAFGDEFAATGADTLTCAEGPENGHWTLMSVLDDALQFAADQGRSGRGMPLLWAAANTKVDIALDEVASHPAVMAVGRSDRRDRVAVQSAYGDRLEFLAPGIDIYNLSGPAGEYEGWSGNSFAAPAAAGLGALILAVAPELSGDELRDLMRQCCRKTWAAGGDAQRHPQFGYGILDAARAIDLAAQQ